MQMNLVVGSKPRALLLVLVALLSLPACSMLMDSAPPELPEELAEPGVRAGEGWLMKELWVADDRLGLISDLEVAVGEVEALVVGTRGALAVTLQGVPGGFTRFSKRASHVETIDAGDGDGDDRLRYMSRGGGWQPVSVFRADGTLVWEYGPSPAPNSLAAGDLEGDGQSDFVVGMNGGGGVRRLDQDGQEVWRVSDRNVWQVELFDVDADGRLEILHSNASGELTVRDDAGEVLVRQESSCYFSEFAVLTLPGVGPTTICVTDMEQLELREPGGDRVSKLSAPLSDDRMDLWASTVRLDSDRDPYLAVLLRSGWSWNRSILHIYEVATDELLYQEVLGSDCQSLASAPVTEDNSEGLLVGCENKVHRYVRADLAK